LKKQRREKIPRGRQGEGVRLPGCHLGLHAADGFGAESGLPGFGGIGKPGSCSQARMA
jgi:hypothetical protein